MTTLLEYLMDGQPCGKSHIPDGRKCHVGVGANNVLKQLFREFAGDMTADRSERTEAGVEALRDKFQQAVSRYAGTKKQGHKQQAKDYNEARKHLEQMPPEEFQDRLKAAYKRQNSIATKGRAQQHLEKSVRRQGNAIALLKSAGIDTREFEENLSKTAAHLSRVKRKPVRKDGAVLLREAN